MNLDGQHPKVECSQFQSPHIIASRPRCPGEYHLRERYSYFATAVRFVFLPTWDSKSPIADWVSFKDLDLPIGLRYDQGVYPYAFRQWRYNSEHVQSSDLGTQRQPFFGAV